MIYLASPYSHDDPAVRQQRFDAVCKVASELMRAGKHIFCPIAHTHPIALYGLPKGWDFWGEYDRWFIEHCDALVVVRLPGWDESVGIRAEIELAESLGKRVEYMDTTAWTDVD